MYMMQVLTSAASGPATHPHISTESHIRSLPRRAKCSQLRPGSLVWQVLDKAPQRTDAAWSSGLLGEFFSHQFLMHHISKNTHKLSSIWLDISLVLQMPTSVLAPLA